VNEWSEGNHRIQLWKGDDYEEISLEDLYQQFKARMLDEMRQAEMEAQRRYMDIRMKVPRRKEGGE
jgi:hypothetical protein